MRRRAVVAVVVLVAAVGLLGSVPHEDGPAAATPAAPNIVFVLTDDQSLEALAIGMRWLDAGPGGHWVRFEHAVVNTSLCCPSRATILTGRYSHKHGVISNTLGQRLDESSTLATWLDAAGYRTGLIGKYLNQYPFARRGPVVPPGWDEWTAFREGQPYRDFEMVHEDGIVTQHPKGYSTDRLTKWAVRFVEDPSPDPFFLYLAYNAPHGPRTPAKRHVGAFENFATVSPPNLDEADVSDKPQWVQDLPLATRKVERKRKAQRRLEYETLLAVDEGLQKLYEALDETGTLDDTVIVFMTDNGHVFGEHRVDLKLCPYEECVRTPLLVRYPAGPAETRTVDALASNVDIAPTLAELGGTSPATPVDGASLVPFLEGDDPPSREGVLIELRSEIHGIPRYWAVRTSTHKLVEYDNGERELYDLVADPYELENLAGQEPALEAELRDLLMELRGA